MSSVRLAPVLAGSIGMFGGRIGWDECASHDPSEWDPADLEIFYSLGRCHHFALALHRTEGFRIAVLFETDPDELDDPRLPLPHHVFVVDGSGAALDVRGRRPIRDVVGQYAGTVGLSRPEIAYFDREADFRRVVVERGDDLLAPIGEGDVEAAQIVLLKRYATLPDEIAALREAFLAEMEAARSAVCPRP